MSRSLPRRFGRPLDVLDRLRRRVLAAWTLPRLLVGTAMVVVAVGVLLVVGRRSATVEVWTLARDVPAGSEVEQASLALVALPADSPLLEVLWVVDAAPPQGIAREALTVGQPLLPSDLEPAGPGRRTVAIPVDGEVVGALGLAEGERVDVVRAGGADGARIVAAGLRIAAVERDDGPVRADAMVVLEVDPATALDLADALAAGSVTLLHATGAEPWSGLADDVAGATS